MVPSKPKAVGSEIHTATRDNYALADMAKTPSSPMIRVQETNAGVEYTGPDHTWNDQRDMQRLGKKQELRVCADA